MKKKQKVDIYTSLVLIVMGIIILLLPILDFTNIYILSIIMYSIYALIGLIKFILLLDTKDYEGLHIVLSSIIPLITTIIIKPDLPHKLALILGMWITLMALTKLKKVDYYHDRHDRMWKVRTLILFIFVISGLLSSLNLAFTEPTQVIVFGFLTIIHGTLEIFDPILKTLI